MSADVFAVFVADPSVAEEAAVALASLPVSLAPGEQLRGSFALVSGTGAWAERAAAAVGAGARGVMVLAPDLAERPADRECVERLAQRAGDVPILLHRPFLDDPSVLLPEARRMADGAAAVVSDRFLRTDEPMTASLFAHLALLRVFVGPVASVEHSVFARGGYSVSATLVTGTSLLVGGIVSDHEEIRVRVRMLRPPERLYAEILSDLTSRSARIVLTDLEGDRTLPSDYESSWRSAWRRLLRAAREGVPPRDVADYLGDLRVLDLVRERRG